MASAGAGAAAVSAFIDSGTLICLGFPRLSIIILLYFFTPSKARHGELAHAWAQARPIRRQAHDPPILLFFF
ncbi:hypothetical protein EHI44_22230 [Rhizobium leguminosarum]|uniref:hypothetical protein n=1 Tax=Rhizobium TaxID=379 RepID=UPI000FEED86D|nr:hypothetical protein [Rhizobium leguminosarum]RWY83449.1 hypothetical protein EHI44_22230 [Rhizobium leguminosarum]